MIEEKLEIVIPTYNRAEYLDNTLNEIFNSPLKDCKITIRNNASKDNTQEICEKYERLFKNCNIITNKINIGGNANILRSYEEAEAPYVWVISDNDLYNFKECEDFIKAIESEKYDLIMTCSQGFPNNDGESLMDILKRNSAKENYLEHYSQDLVEIFQKYYFLSMSFICTNVYKTKKIQDSETFITGYDYISKSYPHYAFVNKSLNENFLIYKTKTDLLDVQPNPDDWEIHRYEHIARVLEASLLFSEKYRKYASQFFGGSSLIVAGGMLIIAKAHDEKNLRRSVLKLLPVFLELKGWFLGLIYDLLILLAYLIPTPICKLIAKTFKNINY